LRFIREDGCGASERNSQDLLIPFILVPLRACFVLVVVLVLDRVWRWGFAHLVWR